MLVDPLSGLRLELTSAIKSLWRNVPDDQSPKVFSLDEDLVQEIVNTYLATPEHRDSFDDDSTGSLPLMARRKPQGVFEDDWRARPTTERPWPVILIHGTGDTKGYWQQLGADLRHDGWVVFAPDFGRRATGPIKESAEQIKAYIEVVLATTGTEQAILVGHSQGGVLIRYWMRLLGGAPHVKHLVSLAVPNHGTTMGGIVSPLLRSNRGEAIAYSVAQSWFGEACVEIIRGHPTIEAINAGGDLDPGVTYTCISTHFDTVIQPPETCFLESDDPQDADRIRNLWVESLSPQAVVMHETMPFDINVRALVRADLNRLLPAK